MFPVPGGRPAIAADATFAGAIGGPEVFYPCCVKAAASHVWRGATCQYGTATSRHFFAVRGRVTSRASERGSIPGGRLQGRPRQAAPRAPRAAARAHLAVPARLPAVCSSTRWCVLYPAHPVRASKYNAAPCALPPAVPRCHPHHNASPPTGASRRAGRPTGRCIGPAPFFVRRSGMCATSVLYCYLATQHTRQPNTAAAKQRRPV